MSFFVILLLIFGIAAAAYIPFHNTAVEWMATIKQPACALPDWACGLGWMCTYLLMVIAVWFVWKEREEKNIAPALGIFLLQFFVNISWGPLVVRSQSLNTVLIYLFLLFLLVIWNMIVFWRISKNAGMLFVPYLIWITYSLYVQTLTWQQNC